jgi:fluoride ion exporter CrcB/FEX
MLEVRAYGMAAVYLGASLLVAMLAVVCGLWAGARLAQ